MVAAGREQSWITLSGCLAPRGILRHLTVSALLLMFSYCWVCDDGSANRVKGRTQTSTFIYTSSKQRRFRSNAFWCFAPDPLHLNCRRETLSNDHVRFLNLCNPTITFGPQTEILVGLGLGILYVKNDLLILFLHRKHTQLRSRHYFQHFLGASLVVEEPFYFMCRMQHEFFILQR